MPAKQSFPFPWFGAGSTGGDRVTTLLVFGSRVAKKDRDAIAKQLPAGLGSANVRGWGDRTLVIFGTRRYKRPSVEKALRAMHAKHPLALVVIGAAGTDRTAWHRHTLSLWEHTLGPLADSLSKAHQDHADWIRALFIDAGATVRPIDIAAHAAGDDPATFDRGRLKARARFVDAFVNAGGTLAELAPEVQLAYWTMRPATVDASWLKLLATGAPSLVAAAIARAVEAEPSTFPKLLRVLQRAASRGPIAVRAVDTLLWKHSDPSIALAAGLATLDAVLAGRTPESASDVAYAIDALLYAAVVRQDRRAMKTVADAVLAAGPPSSWYLARLVFVLLELDQLARVRPLLQGSPPVTRELALNVTYHFAVRKPPARDRDVLEIIRRAVEADPALANDAQVALNLAAATNTPTQ